MSDDLRELAKDLCMGAPCAPKPCPILNERSCMCVRAGNTIISQLDQLDHLRGVMERINRYMEGHDLWEGGLIDYPNSETMTPRRLIEEALK